MFLLRSIPCAALTVVLLSICLISRDAEKHLQRLFSSIAYFGHAIVAGELTPSNHRRAVTRDGGAHVLIMDACAGADRFAGGDLDGFDSAVVASESNDSDLAIPGQTRTLVVQAVNARLNLMQQFAAAQVPKGRVPQ